VRSLEQGGRFLGFRCPSASRKALDHRFKTHDPRLARGSLANPAELTRLASPAG